jgi:hypothetical protein
MVSISRRGFLALMGAVVGVVCGASVVSATPTEDTPTTTDCQVVAASPTRYVLKLATQVE